MTAQATVGLQALLGGRFRAERPLGPGTSSSSVWQVLDLESGGRRRIAVKWLHRGAGPAQRSMFEREYRALTTLSHPSIVRVYDYGCGSEGAFYSMELLSGADLGARAPMPWREACLCLRDVASALALVHTRGLLHRDLSPANVWRREDGAIKLIDFGAVTSFGVPDEIAGTPPFVPPEAVFGQALDQRSDLYALGALGYWLITGEHAYPARTLEALTRAWNVKPATLRERIAAVPRVAQSDGPPPQELQLLVEALLSQSASARPVRAAEVIDRLQVIADLERESAYEVGRSYLISRPFVGRAGELCVLDEALDIARRGSGRCVMIEGTGGTGRSRLCEEMGLRAKLAGSLVLHTQLYSEQRAYGLAEDLALRLLDEAHEDALVAARPHLRQLATVSARLCGRLGIRGTVWSEAARESSAGRLVILRALKAWFLEVARTRPLLVMVDNIGLADEVSLAWLTGLADEVGEAKLLLLLARSADAPAPDLGMRRPHRLRAKGRGGEPAQTTALDGLIHRSQRIALGPLSQTETHDLLGFMFGDVPHQRRLAERIYRSSSGNPAHAVELCEYLVRTGMIRYQDGAWQLPMELAIDQLPESRGDMLLEQLAQLHGAERELAQVLSVPQGPLLHATVWLLSDFAHDETERLCNTLIRMGILRSSHGELRFAHGAFREVLLRELGMGERRRRAHARLAESVLSRQPLTALDRLRAGAHLLRAGEDRRGAALVVEASVELQGPAAHRDAVADLEEVVALMSERGFSQYELMAPLARLATTSYYCDRRLAQRYGDRALTTLAQALRLSFAQRLAPWLGARLGLFVALAVAASAFHARRRNPCVPRLRAAFELLFSTVTSLTGVHTVCVDPVAATRSASVLAPFAALGTDHVAGFSHAYCMALATTVKERMGEAVRAWQPLIRRLQTDPPIRKMPDTRRHDLLAGGLYALGALYTLGENSEALLVADELDRLDQGMYAMAADQIRSVFQATLGKVALFHEFNQRVEMHAIERGSAWQVETWAAGASIGLQLRADDRAGMKVACDELRRLASEIPSFEVLARRAEGATLLLQGSLREALVPLEECLRERPRETVGWARAHGALARAYNELGEHARAREVCKLVFDHMPAEDLSFPVQHIALHVERAMAEAGLGELGLAAEQLDALLRKYQTSNGPLTQGALHEARARVALMQEDRPGFEMHLLRMQNWYLPTALPNLVQRCHRLAQAGARLRGSEVGTAGFGAYVHGSHASP